MGGLDLSASFRLGTRPNGDAPTLPPYCVHVPCLLLEESDGSLSCSHRWMILECCMFGFGEVWWLAELLALLDDLSLSVLCVDAS